MKLPEVIRVRTGKTIVRRKASSRDARAPSTRRCIDGDSDSDMSMPQSSTKRLRPSRSPEGRSVSSRMVTPMGKMRDIADLGTLATTGASPAHESQAPAAMSVVDFMREKQRLKKEVDATIAAARSKHALGPRLASALEKLTEAQKTEVVGSPKDILDNIEKAISQLEDHKQKMNDLKPEGIPEAQSQLTALTSALDQIAKSGDEVYEGIKFIMEQAKTEVRQVQFQLRHQRQRLQNKLAAAGYGQHFAKVVAEVMQSNGDGTIGTGIKANPDPAAMDFSCLMAWGGADEAGKPFLELFRAPFGFRARECLVSFHRCLPCVCVCVFLCCVFNVGL